MSQNSSTYFVSPPPGSSDAPPWSQNHVYQIGSKLNITWVTNETDFGISLGQQYSLTPNHYTLDSGTPIFDSSTGGSSTRSFIWTVSTASFSLNTSTVYYLQIGQSSNAYVDAATCQYFNISEPVSHAPSNSTPQSNATTTTSDPSSSNSTTSSATSTSTKVGLGVGLGVGIPILLALLAFLAFTLVRRRRSRRQGRQSKDHLALDSIGMDYTKDMKSHELDSEAMRSEIDGKRLSAAAKVSELEDPRFVPRLGSRQTPAELESPG